jgi:hypothetical protein
LISPELVERMRQWRHLRISCIRRYLAKGTVPDHGEEWVSSGHRDYDYLEWIARLTSHIPDRGTHLVHYYGAYSNAHRGVARRRETFREVPPEDEPPDP